MNAKPVIILLLASLHPVWPQAPPRPSRENWSKRALVYCIGGAALFFGGVVVMNRAETYVRQEPVCIPLGCIAGTTRITNRTVQVTGITMMVSGVTLGVLGVRELYRSDYAAPRPFDAPAAARTRRVLPGTTVREEALSEFHQRFVRLSE